MKKLMIAAAAAAMIGGAFADLCTDTTDPTGCAVYDVKFTLKSLGPKLLKIKGSSNTCGETTAECCTYFDSATYTFNGIIWACEASCDTLSKDSDSVKYVMWSTKAKMPVTAQLEYDTSNKVWSAATTEFSVLDRYGKKGDKVQAIFGIYDLVTAWSEDDAGELSAEATGAITAAGFGTFDIKNARVKSISGNAVASLGVPTIPGYYSDKDDWEAMTTIFAKQKCDNPVPFMLELCDELDSWCDLSDPVKYVAASGTWSIKYSSSKSKGNKTLRQLVPAYAVK